MFREINEWTIYSLKKLQVISYGEIQLKMSVLTQLSVMKTLSVLLRTSCYCGGTIKPF